MELINKDTPQVKEFISSLDSMLNGIESIVKHYKPHLNGERFLSNHEVSKKLNVSLRTLQEWRDTGLIPFIQIKGKIIYRNDKEYLLSIIYVSETTKQASPATYEIQQDDSQYFISIASKRLYVDYDPAKDVLNISSLGHYLRN